MRSDIYRRIVFLIDEYRTWVKVDNADHYEVCSVKLDERQFPCVCRTLALRSCSATDTTAREPFG